MSIRSFITWLIITGALLFPASSFHQSGSASLSINGGVISAGSSLTSTINVSIPGGSSLGAATIDISYDPAVVDAVSCSADPSGAFDSKVCNANFDNDGVNPDTVRFSLISTGGVGGSLSLANITFQAVGSGGAATTLSINPVTFTDINGTPIPVSSGNGSVSIPSPTETFTPIPPTATQPPPTNTPLPAPSNTPQPAPSNTPQPAAPTNTPIPGNPTNTPVVYSYTNTPAVVYSPTNTGTPSGAATATRDPQPSRTPTETSAESADAAAASETPTETVSDGTDETPLESAPAAPQVPVSIPADLCGCTSFAVDVVTINAARTTGVLSLASPGLVAEFTNWGCDQEPANLMDVLAIWQVNTMIEMNLEDQENLIATGIQTAKDLAVPQSACVNPATWISAFTRQLITIGYPSNLVVTESPVFPLFVDLSGNMAGFLESGEMVENLPLAIAFELGEKRAVWYSGEIETYVIVNGYENGSMNLHTTIAGQPVGETTSFYDVEVKKGMVAMLDTTDNEHVLLIDDDRDGISNRQFKPETNTNAYPQSDDPAVQAGEKTGNQLTITALLLAGLFFIGLLALGIIGWIIIDRQRLKGLPTPSDEPVDIQKRLMID